MLTLDETEWKALPRAYKDRMMLIKGEAFDQMVERELFRPATVADVMGIMHGVMLGRHPVTGVVYCYHYPRQD